jgi:NADP-dependent 3-hydroxy acid dehydrogenase YdfG
MSLLSIYSEGTTSTHLAKSLITGFIVAIVDNDPQYEENLAILVKKLDRRVGQAIAIQYLSAIFAADLIYILDPYYVWRYYQILWWVMRTPWRFIRSVLQNVWWLIQTWRFIVGPWDWQREVVVVNGGSSGIGALIVSQLAEYGIKVVILDAKPPEQTTLLELRNVSFYDIDPTSSENIARAACWIRGALGHPTVLINTAGTRSYKPLVEESEDAIRAIFDANTNALLLVKEFLPHMAERNHGHVVTVASFAVQTSSIGSNCTRAATLAFHESLKQELKHRYKAYKVRTT